MQLTKEQRKEIIDQVKLNIENYITDYLWKVQHKHIITMTDKKLLVDNLKLLMEIEERWGNV